MRGRTAKQSALAAACPCELFLLAVIAFQVRFQMLDLVTLKVLPSFLEYPVLIAGIEAETIITNRRRILTF
jgi:hypothetical protein